MGWKTYRIPSRLSFSDNVFDPADIEEDDYNYTEKWEEYLSNTLEGVLICICNHSMFKEGFIPEEFKDFTKRVAQKYLSISYQSRF